MSCIDIVRRTAVIAATLAVTIAGTVITAPAAYAAACSVHWGSSAKSTQSITDRQVVGVRAGRHKCYDRFVIDLNGRAAKKTGYHVWYDDQDLPSIRGGAVLEIDVQALQERAERRRVPRVHRRDEQMTSIHA